MRILVTGATGFVGRNLSSMLPDAYVRFALRSERAAIPGSDCAIVGEINARTDWRAALEGVDCVVHLAARVHAMNPDAEDRRQFWETNVLGTEQLAAAAVANGVRRFIFLSSIKVNGESGGNTFTVASSTHPEDEYGISKLQAELKLFEIAASSSMTAVAIRPPLVYGPEVRANFLRLLSWIHKGIPLPLGRVRNSRSLVSVWNLCDLIRHIVYVPSIESGVVLVSDGEDISTPDLVRRLASAMHRPARLLPVPPGVLALLTRIVGKAAEASRLTSSLTVDISETKRCLRWSPPLSVDDGIARTVQWYLQTHGKRRD